ncbi:hypothetical protein R5W24_004349 [Gemmata sp. JC717]|uniref:hypothetical protein n=1 Tax=Gemmata algarum TaxID=2975278 RepID=UPI0021BA6901|nr:hypothetical protein [Gemmata algarum]MDY3555211.1 hypothetical protein [Gemmata algarum]
MALELATVYPGMMIAVPPAQWAMFGTMSGVELARHLRARAEKINLKKVKKSPPRKPTKTKTERIEDKSPHVSTARLLADDKKNRQSQRRQQKRQ